MRRPFLLIVVLLAPLAHASDVDDAIAAVKDAQTSAGDCKGLSTKLKLALEALDDAKKSPARIGPAKGRVENAKDAAAKACSDAAKGKVTASLDTALAALDKAATPKKVEHTGAAFGANCASNDDCQSEHCYLGANPPGHCSKPCSAPADCPASWQCRKVSGNMICAQ
jgi:hypothetical protein